MGLPEFKGKVVLIMGLGLHGGGVGAARFFAGLGSRVIVTDLKSRRELALSLFKLKRSRGITYHLGGHRAADFRNADVVIQGPGVPEHSKFLKMARRAGVPVLSDVEIFFRTSPAPIIGITGTKGKSTTTYLLDEFLKRGLRKRVWVGGNIRRSVLEFLARVRRGDLVVLELSSFQLDSLKRSRMSPTIAVITNIFPDHLNRYPSMRAYIASKANIFRFQEKNDLLFTSAKDALVRRLAREAPSRVIRFDPGRIARRFRTSLPAAVPTYHVPNIAAAIAVARHLGVGEGVIKRVLAKFRGMPGRMERVRVLRGVAFVNDTTATNPTAAAQAVREIKRVIGRSGLHVIAGGYDKGLPVGEFTRALGRHAASVIFLPGKASEKIKQKLQRGQGEQRPPAYGTKTMREAVRIAWRNARRGDAVLLSPGAASFGLFAHEFERGDAFVRAVRRLKPKP